MYNVLEYLEDTVKRLPDKLAFSDGEKALTFKEIHEQSKSIGTFLYKEGIYKEPVLVFTNRQAGNIAMFLGSLYSGNFYVPVDEEMSKFRIELILENTKPKAILCDESTFNFARSLNYEGGLYLYEEIIGRRSDQELLEKVRDLSIDTDPIYIVYTSGSTGSPKGVVANHRSVIDYIESFSEALGFSEETIFGNQSPLYFDACLKEIFPTLKFGASTYIIPKNLFMFPINLVDFLNQHKINTLCWVVSALTMVSAFKAFDKVMPKYINTIAFVGEVFPMKQFHIWKENLPKAKYINLYGPTETTGVCSYFEVNRDFAEDEVFPIGRPFKNTEIILLDEDNKTPQLGQVGEICVRGTSLTLGYYKDFERTGEAFVQNPLNDAYPDLIYRTGDLGKYNENGELVFSSRKDYQIKHMGHRIELGEIEVAVNTIEGIKSSCSVYDNEKKKIMLYYVGDLKPREITGFLKGKLPRYMVPNSINKLDRMPLTPNGKIDRVYLQKYKNKNKREK